MTCMMVTGIVSVWSLDGLLTETVADEAPYGSNDVMVYLAKLG